ncbi:MAG: peptidoglycan DD-metalloendopeptidase family protein [Desulfocucumaceae bacterium]
MTIKKATAIFLILTVLCGAMAIKASATPDEWILEDGPYLDSFGNDGGGEENGRADDKKTSIYTVCKGETLQGIANRFKVPINELAGLNNLNDPDLIREGQVIFVPGISGSYSVVPGDTLTCIANKFGVSVKYIAAANGIQADDLLVVGRRLDIPGGQISRGGSVPVTASRCLPVGEMEWPVVGWVSSPFGFRDGKPHEGIDIAADYGIPIRSVMPGKVIFAGPRGTYGQTVILDHGEGLTTLYAHSSKILVSQGQWVDKGQLIALVGNTGRSRGPHLHIEVLLNGIPYDPLMCFVRGSA